MNNTTPLDLMELTVIATMEGKPSPKQADEIFDRVKQIQVAEDLSNAAVARLVGPGCSATTWSQIKNGKYGGDIRNIAKVLATWLADHESHAEAPAAEYAATSIGRNIAKICERAWQMPCMATVITPSGAGKTTALRQYVQRRGSRAMYVQAGEVFASRKGLLRMIAMGLGIVTPSGTHGPDLYIQIRRRLADCYCGGKNPPFFLAIDEATTLAPGALNILRNLHDDETCRTAIVLADTARLDAELHSRHGFAGGYEQLRSRMGASWILKPHAEGARKGEVIPAADVKLVAGAILRALGHNGRLQQASFDFLYRIAQTEGTLRRVLHRLHAVHDVAAPSGRADYSVAQLDWVAPLVGARRLMQHGGTVPFGEREKGRQTTAQAGRIGRN